MLRPDVASDVYVFLERSQLGSSLLANRSLRNVICQLEQAHCLPLHLLKCRFDADPRVSATKSKLTCSSLHLGCWVPHWRLLVEDPPLSKRLVVHRLTLLQGSLQRWSCERLCFNSPLPTQQRRDRA